MREFDGISRTDVAELPDRELATRLGVVLPDWITAIAKQEGTGE